MLAGTGLRPVPHVRGAVRHAQGSASLPHGLQPPATPVCRVCAVGGVGSAGRRVAASAGDSDGGPQVVPASSARRRLPASGARRLACQHNRARGRGRALVSRGVCRAGTDRGSAGAGGGSSHARRRCDVPRMAARHCVERSRSRPGAMRGGGRRPNAADGTTSSGGRGAAARRLQLGRRVVRLELSRCALGRSVGQSGLGQVPVLLRTAGEVVPRLRSRGGRRLVLVRRRAVPVAGSVRARLAGGLGGALLDRPGSGGGSPANQRRGRGGGWVGRAGCPGLAGRTDGDATERRGRGQGALSRADEGVSVSGVRGRWCSDGPGGPHGGRVSSGRLLAGVRVRWGEVGRRAQRGVQQHRVARGVAVGEVSRVCRHGRIGLGGVRSGGGPVHGRRLVGHRVGRRARPEVVVLRARVVRVLLRRRRRHRGWRRGKGLVVMVVVVVGGVLVDLRGRAGVCGGTVRHGAGGHPRHAHRPAAVGLVPGLGRAWVGVLCRPVAGGHRLRLRDEPPARRHALVVGGGDLGTRGRRRGHGRHHRGRRGRGVTPPVARRRRHGLGGGALVEASQVAGLRGRARVSVRDALPVVVRGGKRVPTRRLCLWAAALGAPGAPAPPPAPSSAAASVVRPVPRSVAVPTARAVLPGVAPPCAGRDGAGPALGPAP
mmetsp:Transcript_22921/g.86750  ORF Transcript_22921/g.86750 Transcript_22921/m.86750 type:complete len:658 (+) Transcript_22921:365-2338(+)